METRSNHILVGGVVLALLAGLVAFTIWLAGLGGGSRKEYDIFFSQSVEGLAKGGVVTYSGVPSGQVKEIRLWERDPGFVRVRIQVNPETPVLIGTTASIQGSFTGPSSILLDGAVQGAPEITEEGPGPGKVPVIPAKRTGLGALLNSAPQLMERLSALTEKLTDLMSEKNQRSITNILSNTDRLTGDLAKGGPDIRATIAETRIAVRQAGLAAEQVSKLVGTTNTLIGRDGQSLVDDLRKTMKQASTTLSSLDAAVNEARPGIRDFSQQTLPEAGQLVKDLRAMSESLSSVASKLDQGGATALIGSPKLPDYEPGRSQK
jgi:phospholipid/cholesterol/gamma-HCH transport system substrate-binding protein